MLVCAPEDLFGQHFDLVVFGGFVPGWVPKRAYYEAVGATRERLLAEARMSAECARRAADSELVFTGFSECDLEFAEQLGIQYAHIRLHRGNRICELEQPSL